MRPVLLFPIFLAVLTAACSAQAETMVNPHWTGRHCAECHENNAPPALRSGGDINAMCNRCHGPGSEARFEVHQVNIRVPEQMAGRVPAGWPLAGGKLTCLTCHDIKAQMYENVIGRVFNIKFLRSSQAAGESMCFTCHERSRLEQPNPHKLMVSRDGGIRKAACLQCHQELPDTETAREITDAPLKQESDLLCVGCHEQQKTRHPARADHLVQLPPGMKQALQNNSKAGAALQISDAGIHCVTCHNPHARGVIKKGIDAMGAGEPSLLRLPAGSGLCLACHTEFMDCLAVAKLPPVRNILRTPPDILSPHKPWAENKCKACHTVTAEQREKPQALGLCFRQGCHETKLVSSDFVHDRSVLKNCYFCHESHASEYTKLLRTNEERICHTCHPLLREKGAEPVELGEPLSLHKAFVAYQRSIDMEPGNECNFCHSAKHKARISSVATGLCADCHIMAQKALLKAAAPDFNRHNIFTEKKCSACHDPHAGPHKYQLKEPIESYK
jgi:predicted CXXCH cytochrome family protein